MSVSHAHFYSFRIIFTFQCSSPAVLDIITRDSERLLYLHQSVYDYSIRNLCNGFHRFGIVISLYRNSGFLITGMMVSSARGVALCCQKSGSVLPEGWLSNSGQVAQKEPEYSLSEPYLFSSIPLVEKVLFHHYQQYHSLTEHFELLFQYCNH